MIGGGNWNRQNKILNGSYINFVSDKKSSKHISVSPSGILPLKDIKGLILKTLDGFNIMVRK